MIRKKTNEKVQASVDYEEMDSPKDGDRSSLLPARASIALEIKEEKDSTFTASRSASIVSKLKLVSPDKFNEYKAIMDEISAFIRANYEGHMYTRIFQSGSNGYVSAISRFDSMENLKVWTDSNDRKKMIGQIIALAVPGTLDVGMVEGATQWLEVPDQVEAGEIRKKDEGPRRPPPQWKILSLIMLILYPLVIIMNFTFIPYLNSEGYSPVERSSIMFLVALPISSYIILPLVFRIFKRWLGKPRPFFKRHSLMYILDSGFSIFKLTNPDHVSPLQDSLLKRISLAEKYIVSQQEQIQRLQQGNAGTFIGVHGNSNDSLVEKLTEKLSQYDADENDPVTLKVIVKVPSSFSRIYERFLEDFGSAASKYEGFIGFDVIRPSRFDSEGNGIYIGMSKFKKYSQLMEWAASKERAELLNSVSSFTTLVSGEFVKNETVFSHGFESLFLKEMSTIQISSSFDPKNVPAPPPKWKTLILTYFMLLGSFVFFNQVIAPLYSFSLPWPISLFITLFLSILASTYFISPLFNKLFQDWLHSYTQDDIPKSRIGQWLYLRFPGLR
jgi:antibiotic biosynthesis monooxygenase (ABM) superfamily enzyme